MSPERKGDVCFDSSSRVHLSYIRQLVGVLETCRVPNVGSYVPLKVVSYTITCTVVPDRKSKRCRRESEEKRGGPMPPSSVPPLCVLGRGSILVLDESTD